MFCLVETSGPCYNLSCSQCDADGVSDCECCVVVCRVVNQVMKCFHDIKNNIKRRCRQEGADEYQLNYIAPLVEQTRETVLAQCSLTSPYIEYFLSGAPSSPPPHRCAFLTAAVAALTVAHLVAADAV